MLLTRLRLTSNAAPERRRLRPAHRLAIAAFVLMAIAAPAAAQLPPVPVPPENPITEPKRVLGKILFWDAQLSSDNTIACGTCHVTGAGTVDPRFGLHPGLDGVPGTDDDKTGSPGVVRSDADDRFLPDPLFGFAVQVTRRAANPVMMSQYAPEMFWDGRAGGTFLDPEDGTVAIRSGGALETQVVAPPVSDVEMAHAGRDWNQITAKLQTVRPLALATGLPGDVDLALADGPGYPTLFADAFGDEAITARRIAFAIATYERTLVPDETRFDLGTMTPGQQLGFDVFMEPTSACGLCHPPPHFTDFSFRNIGLRPLEEDTGRMEVTGDPSDAGLFKVPSLRNTGLKPTYMHTGHHVVVETVVDFYRGVNGQVQFPENQDPLVPSITIPDEDVTHLLDFVRNALVDLRAANQVFPFDRPTLHTELEANPFVIGGTGAPGDDGEIPALIALSPPNLGNADFKIGIHGAAAGAEAWVMLARTPPGGDGSVDPFVEHGPFVLEGKGKGKGRGRGMGFGTWQWPIPDDAALLGAEVYVQWRVVRGEGDDARTDAARLTFYRDDPTQCDCLGDTDCNGAIDVVDLIDLILRWGECELCGADLTRDGVVDAADLQLLLDAWGGC